MQTSYAISATRVPLPVRGVQVLLAVIAISHLTVPIVMWANQGALRDEIASQHPDFSAGEVARSADIAVTSAAVFHGVLLLLCALLIWKLSTARPWTRRLTAVSQLLSVVFSVFSWSSTPRFHAVIPIIGAIQILTVVLLWAPQPARTFFADGAQRATTV
ncbi:hypothetical protein AB0M54_47475 [Actinoplanes sp. NPDC051470]|uniref:hypothetical protein n=1 Tax=Actinoplanes sp. NPDC051470 TaxID=3157224 RepID=UPI00344A665D